MSEWIALLNAVSAAWAGAMWRASWQGALALALAWVICRVVPRLPASLRCWLWRIAYLKLLLALCWATPVELRILPPRAPGAAVAPLGAESSAASMVPGPLRAGLPASSDSTGERVSSRSAPEAAAPLPLPGPLSVLFLLWLAGACWYAERLNCQWRRTALLRRCCRPARDPATRQLLGKLCRRLRLRREPELLSADVSGPLVMGVVRPAIVLPAGLTATEAEQEWILAHELAHVKRRDLLWAHLPVLTRAVFFFHPAVWLAHQEWRITQEMACDALTVDLTAAPAGGYGEMLVKLAARQRSFPPAEPGTAGILEPGTGLERRLGMLQMDHLSGRRLAWVAVAAAGVGVVSLVPWRLGASAASAASAMAAVAPVKRTPLPPARKTSATEAAARNELARLRAQTAALERELTVMRQSQRDLAEKQAHGESVRNTQAIAADRTRVAAAVPQPRLAPPPSRPAASGPLDGLTDRELLELAGASTGGYSALIGSLSPTELQQYLRVELESVYEQQKIVSQRVDAGIAPPNEGVELRARLQKLEVLLMAAGRRIKAGDAAGGSLAASLTPSEVVQFLRADLEAAVTQLKQEQARFDAGRSTSSDVLPLQTRVRQLELLLIAAQRRASGGK